MNETAKTLSLMSAEQKKELLKGKGIDIGCGSDPVISDCIKFDMEQGDANHITDYIKEKFDFVWSSHCLEDMENPHQAILEWWSLVKPGGKMIIIVPDEDLYEQGVFPSRYNGGHRHTFTISKFKSWSPVSINLLDLIKSLPDTADYSIQLQDCGYDRSMLFWGNSCRIFRSIQRRLMNFRFIRSSSFWMRIISKFASIDQTFLYPDRMAQIQAIVIKAK